MNETLLLLLPVVGVFAVGCSIALLALGKMIDRFPAGDESHRERSLASPVESTTIAVVLFWAVFLTGLWGVLQETRFGMILGITALFAACLFMFTALGFSFAVLSTMRRRKSRIDNPILQVGTPDQIVTIAGQAYAPVSIVSRKRNSGFLAGMVVETLSKKD